MLLPGKFDYWGNPVGLEFLILRRRLNPDR